MECQNYSATVYLEFFQKIGYIFSDLSKLLFSYYHQYLSVEFSVEKHCKIKKISAKFNKETSWIQKLLPGH